MKSTTTPHVATGITTEELVIQFKPSSSVFGYEVVVPAYTRCRKLDGGSEPWVVADLSFIKDKTGIMYHDADTVGVRVPEEKLTGIIPTSP